jgi:hypothetical protein
MRQGNPGWNDWNDPGALFDNDPDFKRQIVSQTEVHVVHD